MTVITFIGRGDLATVLGEALGARHDLRYWSRRSGSAELASGAALVICAVPGGASGAVFEQALPHLSRDTLYVDLTAAAPEVKEAAAARHELYADGAVLGTVATSGAAVPIAA